MTAPLTAGYGDLRDYVAANWTRVVLYSLAGVQQLSLAPGDTRVMFAGSGNPRTITISLLGSDADTTGKTFGRVKLFKASDSGLTTPLADEVLVGGDATLVGLDTLVATLTIELPDI